MITSIRIGYFNVEGLAADKHRTCCSLLDAGVFDILFLSETWFIRNGSCYMAHPYSFLHTKPNLATPKNSRGQEGILLMVSPQARKLIHQHRVLPRAIWIHLGEFSVLATYLPPSMSHDDLRTCLESFPQHDILLGDINVRFSGVTKKAPSKLALQELWRNYMMTRDLTLVPPSEGVALDLSESSIHLLPSSLRPLFSGSQPLLTRPNCELDHVFRSSFTPTSFDLNLLDAPQFKLKSAHKYILLCSIFLSRQNERGFASSPCESIGRFHIGKLDKEDVRKRLARAWSSLDAKTNWDLQTPEQFDSCLLWVITTVAEHVLGTYDVLSRKKTPDRVAPKLIGSGTSPHVAIRLFKRKQRTKQSSLTALQSLSPGRTPMEECLDKYRRLFISLDDGPLPWPELSSDDPLLLRLLSLVDYQSVLRLLKTYPKDKACGIDGLHITLLSALSSTTFASRLSDLFSRCIRAGTAPPRWNSSVMYLLPKTNRPPITCELVRPLSIFPLFRRLYEALLLPAFTDDSLNYCKLHPSQAGFRRGYSTLTQAMVCHHAIESKRIQYVVFLDFKAAYDVTLCSEVMRALESKGIPSRLRSIVLSSMFSDATYQLVVNGSLSPSTERNCGLPQGSPLSPVIFNFFIDSLVAQLNQFNNSNIPRCLFYADDGVLLCADLETAKTLVRIAERWAKDHGMVYNITKCGVLCLRPDTSVQLTLDGNPIPLVESYQYLGFPVTRKGIDFQRHLTDLVTVTDRFLTSLEIEGTEWPPSVRWSIYRTFVRPQMEYGAPLVKAFSDMRQKPKFFEPLQSLQNRAFAWILDATDKHYRVNQGIVGALPIYERFSHLRSRFQFHLDYSDPENPLRRILDDKSIFFTHLASYLRKDSLYNTFKQTDQYSQIEVPDKKSLSQSLSKFLLSSRVSYIENQATILLKYLTLCFITNF
jgi:Reverse transcriptase (RNA-dependent DNA polymerase)